jgi:CheY-like chemotaxis protein
VTLPTDDPPTDTKLRVLIVDDYADSAEAAAMLLTLRGYECRTVSTGQEALELAEAFAPSVVILDIGLPDMSGYEVARALRERAGGAPLFLAAVTGWGQPADRATAFAAGFNCHVTKPADLDKLSLIMKLAAQYFAERDLLG